MRAHGKGLRQKKIGKETSLNYLCGMSQMIPEEIRLKMIQNALEVQEGITRDHAPEVKLFTKYGKGIWLLSELDEKNNIAFGICDLGQGTPELSYVSIEHLESIKHARLKIRMIETDKLFISKYPMSVYLEAARANRRITEDDALLSAASERLSN
jgi:hypothetical protein